ncbi:hypothetical protein PCASD_16084 [Puccinia coronata f. sp. avenae]|uniref:Uncharacterized protein n=1 Tax=Puccinia coronata f. sp. avenae TaxID=200324 RepID=A0A2N5SYE3_9BASI|nr:hypothetical protein PCASD_16084 [Puccinia coronata f. sp. avenae]
MALRIFFQAINHNWRLSEDAEKIQAYETLGLVLRSKAHLITPPVHRILLRSAGIMVDELSSTSPNSPDQLHNLSLDQLASTAKSELKHPNNGLRAFGDNQPTGIPFLAFEF